MLEILFGNKNIEKILFYLLLNEKCYAHELTKVFQSSLSPLQKSLEKLELAGILVSFLEGKTRLFQFNPRYPFLKELKQFLQKAYDSLPDQFKEKYYERKTRKRPRRTGKPL